MRFASLGRSNAGNYARAGKAAADSAADMFATQRKTGPDYGKLSMTAMKTQTEEKIAAMKAEMDVTNAGIKAFTDVKDIQLREQGKEKIRGIGKKLRKAGGIAAIGAIAGAGYLASRDNEGRDKYPDGKARRDAAIAEHQQTIEGITQARDAQSAESMARLEGLISDGSSPSVGGTSTGTSSTGGGAGKVTTGTSTGSPVSGTNSFDMSKLTDQDYDDLAYAVSSEAALGTDDEYGVAANILTRLKSGKYGSSVSQIIHAPGQYEGVYKGLSRRSPDIAARFKSPEGQAKIQEFITRLNGRTEFKGQSMLRNRVAAEDPMFHPKGNFYHYAGQ